MSKFLSATLVLPAKQTNKQMDGQTNRQTNKQTNNQFHTALPARCEVMKRKEEPKRVKESPTPPLVLMMVTGRVAKLAVQVAKQTKERKMPVSIMVKTDSLGGARLRLG